MGRGQRGQGGSGATRRDQDRDGGWAGVISPARPHSDARYPTTPLAPFFSGVGIPRLPQVRDWANPVRAPLPDLSSRPIPSRGRAQQQGALAEMLG